MQDWDWLSHESLKQDLDARTHHGRRSGGSTVPGRGGHNVGTARCCSPPRSVPTVGTATLRCTPHTRPCIVQSAGSVA